MSLVTSSAIRLVDSRLDADVQELSAADARLLDLKISMLDCFYYKVKMQYRVEMFKLLETSSLTPNICFSK
jgi:hypothetical protein